MLDPCVPVIDQLDRYGPSGVAGDTVSRSDAISYVRRLARSHYENFSVLTSLVPASLRDDFASVYAYCRWSDDLADETGSDDAARARSSELLSWWRSEMHACFEGRASHPVFIALASSIERHALPREPFDHLLDAFEQDQHVRRYETWDEVLAYCRKSADPVGRIVLHLGGYPNTPSNASLYEMSDATCSALQLINFWQDVRRDLLERDRIYMPSAETGIDGDMLRAWVSREDDPSARVRFIRALRPLVDRTREMFETGRPLPGKLSPSIRPVVWLFGAGGRAVLEKVDRAGCTTLWHRPRLGKGEKTMLVARAWCASKLVRKSEVGSA